MPTAIFMKDSGSRIKHMVKEHILTPMEPTTTVTGLMTNSMVTEWSPGQMVLSTKVTISTERRKEKANLPLLTEAIMKVNSSRMRYVGMESTTGQMVNNMMENGAITKCMVKGH